MKLKCALLATVVAIGAAASPAVAQQARLRAVSIPVIQKDGLSFKDLNRNGAVDPYEDWRLDSATRARDLVSRMTVEEKAGAMMHGIAPASDARGVPGRGTAWDYAAFDDFIKGRNITHFLNRISGSAASLASQYNKAQELTETSRLGVPLTISTDPRNGFVYQQGASVASGAFSQWPDAIGLAATGDPEIVRRHADTARREYLAVGIRMALSPQADLATEPRWPRAKGTFGEDAEVARTMVNAYVAGFQGGKEIGPNGVATIVKHWVGYGAASPKGQDAHSHYARHLDITSQAMETHLYPFLGAFDAGVTGVMPTYGVLPGGITVNGVNGEIERVGAGFNKQLLTELLRGRFKFDGIVLTDWAIMEDCGPVCLNGAKPGEKPAMSDIAMPWGMENATKAERYIKSVDAGVDQFGGIDDPSTLIQLVKTGKIAEQRLDTSAVRLMELKFRQGLFENPYVDEAEATAVVGNPEFLAAAEEAQIRSLVLLENRNKTLPLAKGRKLFLHNVAPEAAAAAGFTVVKTIAEADLAVVRTSTPFERPHPNYFFGGRYSEGRIEFKDGDPDFEVIKVASAKIPTVVTVYMDRAAALGNVRDKAAAVIANFGVGDAPLFRMLTGEAEPTGKLPFEMPATDTDAAEQRPDTPRDLPAPLYAYGYGLTY